VTYNIGSVHEIQYYIYCIVFNLIFLQK